MADLRFSELIAMQKELQDKHIGEWAPLTPENGRSCLLWMVEELGEVISIIKKSDEKLIMTDEKIHRALREEFADVMMFMVDALICYGISASDFSEAFIKKHAKNMKRDWKITEAEFNDILRAR